jgi:hypothetical protein
MGRSKRFAGKAAASEGLRRTVRVRRRIKRRENAGRNLFHRPLIVVILFPVDRAQPLGVESRRHILDHAAAAAQINRKV